MRIARELKLSSNPHASALDVILTDIIDAASFPTSFCLANSLDIADSDII